MMGTTELLAQLDVLKNTAQDFAQREEKMTVGFNTQIANEDKALALRQQQLLAAETARRVVLETDFARTKQGLEAWFHHRQTRINRLHAVIRENQMERVNALEADCKQRAHQGLMEAERQHDLALAELKAAHERFTQRQLVAAAEFALFENKMRGVRSGIGSFRKLLKVAAATENSFGNGNEMLDEAAQIITKIEAELFTYKTRFIPSLLRFVPLRLAIFLLMGVYGLGAVQPRLELHWVSPAIFCGLVGWLVLIVMGLIWSRRRAEPVAKKIAADFIRARSLVLAAPEQAMVWQQSETTRIENEFADTKNVVNSEWKRESREISQQRNNRPVELETRIAQLEKRNGDFYQSKLQRHTLAQESVLAQMQTNATQQFQAATEIQAVKRRQLTIDLQVAQQGLVTIWEQKVLPLVEKIRAAAAAVEVCFPQWPQLNVSQWQAPTRFLNAVKFARLEIETAKFFPMLPKDARLTLSLPERWSLPLLLAQPAAGSLLIETNKQGDAEATAAINNLILRLLASTPPGRIEFTIFDPVGLGQNFATLMHLADYEARAINSRIWTQPAQFEEKLAELNEHMEKIIQMYLRNEYATIAEYNAQAGSVAEKYYFLIIASFPVNFTDTAAKRLRNIAASGARCGVFTLVHWDQRNAAPTDFVPDELRQHSVNLVRTENGFEFSNWRPAGAKLFFDAPPTAELATEFLHRVGELGRNSNRVEVPFESVAPLELWQESTHEILRVPIGRSGATKFQQLEIGSGTRQHALIVGKTGSGKSTLFHVIITNLALRCSPEQVEFYLVDFKKGVEFKCYGNRKLPHAKVVAIESDREFGLSVLQRVDDELRRRGDLFREVGAQDLAGYRRREANKPVPRTLLLIDEFQEFFTEEDRISQGAAVLLDRIVRQGRAFGIHVILGSQTLGGAYTLARATLGQMVIRIALQCNEADAYLIMDQDNPAPRLLTRPGEGIYNDAAGALEGNAPFQAVWLADKTRDCYLEKIRQHADEFENKYPGPLVFEGNAPAEVRENLLLQSALQKPAREIPLQPRIWLGAPNSIKGPTEAIFQRQSGSNLLIVGQSEERTTTILSLALISLAAQFPKNTARFFVLANAPTGISATESWPQIQTWLPQAMILANNSNVSEIMATLAAELKLRLESETAAPAIFVLIQGLQFFKKLRTEDEFSFSGRDDDAPNPAAILARLLTEGAAHGIHLIVVCDTYNNVTRFLGRKALTEFEMRVAFQMSAGDSASLVDAPNAANLGLHRAVLFNEREASLETFRPYSPPDNAWLNDVKRHLVGS